MRIQGIVALAVPLVILAARPAPAEEARAVIDRAVVAAGGEVRLGRLKAVEWTCKGTAHASTALAFTDHYFVQWPEQLRHESAVESGGQKLQRALILDGEHGWIKDDRGATVLSDATRDELRDKVHVLYLAATLLPLRDKGVTLKPLDDVKIDDRLAAGVSATCEGRPELRLYFDKDKGLLLKCARTVTEPLSRDKVTEETFFSDYHDVEGVQVARKLSVRRGGKPFLDWEVTDYQVRAKLDRGLFAAP